VAELEAADEREGNRGRIQSVESVWLDPSLQPLESLLLAVQEESAASDKEDGSPQLERKHKHDYDCDFTF
jgi:hypothetical protein